MRIGWHAILAGYILIKFSALLLPRTLKKFHSLHFYYFVEIIIDKMCLNSSYKIVSLEFVSMFSIPPFC